MNVGQVLESHLGYAARWGWNAIDGRAETAGPIVRGTETKTRPINEPVGQAHDDKQKKPMSEQATHQGGGGVNKDHKPHGPGADKP